jgi:hypothetical protein
MTASSCGSRQQALLLLPVTFITPAGDPVNKPVASGTDAANIPDGANQFTYDASSPGILTIKLKAKVPGISGMGKLGVRGNWGSGKNGTKIRPI